ncbi:MAG: hypothetical protein HY815_23335 [Candidatus Riflebacteria bacterium]|nr:hypothetical protein [Candidatus Riflebacteria bacterium]
MTRVHHHDCWGLVAALLTGLLLLVAGGGCSEEVGRSVPLAGSAAQSGLALTVRVPAATVPGAGSGRAAATPVSALATRLVLEIGESSAPDVVRPPPFPLTGGGGPTYSFTVGNIPPGLKKRVAYRAEDAGGAAVSSGLFFLDFLPGQLTSNDFDLGVPGKGTGGPAQGRLVVTESTGKRLVEIDVATGTLTPIYTWPPTGNEFPHSVAAEPSGSFVVTEIGLTSGNLVRISAGGTLTPMSTGMPTPRGLVADGSGNWVVALETALVTVLPDGTRTLITPFSPSEGHPVAVVADGGGSYIVTMQFLGNALPDRIYRIDAAGTKTTLVDYAADFGIPDADPMGVAIDPSNGDLIVGEAALRQLSRIRCVAGNPPQRTVIANLAGNNGEILRDPDGNFVVVEMGTDKLVRITSSGGRQELFAFTAGASPLSVIRVN